MSTVFITGANRGIGLEFARQYAADGWRVLAACRNPRGAKELAGLAGDVRVHALDVIDEYQLPALAKSLNDEAIDILINNAGVGGFDDSFGNTPTNEWLETLRVNAIAPLHVAEQFLPHLERGQRRLIVNITSRMGSIADNGSGGSYSYRTSKAALNMVAKSMAHDLKGRRIIVVVFHPGWVKTDMGGAQALLPPKASVGGMRAKIATLTAADSGKFFNYDGKPLPW
jgi:NAD(P)-dependent dehydrogenase (short-subunit alcohol dehydrogenase family)